MAMVPSSRINGSDAVVGERIGIRRHFTADGVHPYDQVAWERRDSRITNYRDGTVAFEQLGVEVPATWSLNATNILAQKYFRGAPGTPERETSLRQVADRVVDTIAGWGTKDGYFADESEAEAFTAELKYLIITQRAAFNSPVWFNIGAKGRKQQASACFILSVDDTMSSILNWYVEEGIIFKGGSGAGVNLSRIRSSAERLKGGGTASGPVSFMRGADASAGTIKSGGATRRAAKMVILNADHPDIEHFVWCKAVEERKARALREAGFDMDLDGKDSHSTQYQNANNSVRVTDEFMQAVVDDADWHLRAVTTGDVVRTVKARDLMRQISEATWECADPGMQFDTTINRWHTAANTGRINGSNPCSEYMHLDDSACNLASINLLAFLDEEANRFDVEGYRHAVEVMFTAQEILVGNADYPTEAIAETSRRFRQLGLGYANLGALLMALGLPYDSDAGRSWAGALTAVLTGHAYATSARTAARMGAFAGYTENEEHMLRVLRMHRDELDKLDERLLPAELAGAARQAWNDAVEWSEAYGVRNSQATVLAPTGCLTGGSLVITERGLVRLRSLGDPDGRQWQGLGVGVATDEGVREATQFYVNGLERVVDVVTAQGHRIHGTTTHRVKVVDETGAWVWRRMADLHPGDRVPLALGHLFGGPQPVALPSLAEAYRTGEDHVRAPREMSVELAELIGYFMGDGSVHSRGVSLFVSDTDLDVIDRLRVLGKELFGLEAHVTECQGYHEVAFHSVHLVAWWEACGLAKHQPRSGQVGKGWMSHIPDAVLHTNDPVVYGGFVRGLFEAGGTVSDGYPCLTTTSVELSQEVQSLLLALGFPTTRRFDTSGGGSAPAVLRLLDVSQGRRWTEEIGFLGNRKNAAVSSGENQQSPRYDQMVGFIYDTVASATLGGEELTYDLSVPDNVTYLANGFVSHNTIGLLMDCDTTGVEPDLGLCKMKKLVGGGTMTIVNRTVPRALRRLGYTTAQVEAIVAYIDEHKTILGAPHLAADHVAVFACSMGDNAIHYTGHIRMMGAVQPWISGAISKTVNMPEEVSVEDVEQLHIDAWKLGIKAVAIYRDNCKVAQPLSMAKKEVKPEQLVAAVEAAIETAPPQVVERIVERVVKQPVRQKLPRNRRSRTFEFRVADCKGFVTVGEYDDGRPGELFLRVSKQGSTLAGIMDAFAISVSHGLQYGVPLKAFIEAFTNMRFEPAGMTDDADIRFATSLVDYIFRRLAVDYLPMDERMELGILSVGERHSPTLPGIEEAAVETNAGLDVIPSPPAHNTAAADLDPMAKLAPTVAKLVPAVPAETLARPANSDAPYCMQCGVQMIRAGSCHACPSCGSTSGCS